MTHDRTDDLRARIEAGDPLPELLDELRDWEASGVSREQTRLALEEMRERVPAEEGEDRILELLDYVSGFCSHEQSIWPEDPATDYRDPDHNG